MTPEYIAGFIDGEGCINFMRTGKTRRYVPRVSVVNTNKEILEELQKQYGGSLRTQRSPEHWKQPWHWRVTSRAAVRLLDCIGEHLRIKYNQALLVAGWDAIRPGHGNKWTEDMDEAMELLVDQSHWLNQKGPQTRPEPMVLALPR